MIEGTAIGRSDSGLLLSLHRSVHAVPVKIHALPRPDTALSCNVLGYSFSSRPDIAIMLPEAVF